MFEPALDEILKKAIKIPESALWVFLAGTFAVGLALAYLAFRYAGTVTKIVVGYIVFCAILILSIIVSGLMSIKNFRETWLRYEFARIQEGSFVFLEKYKRNIKVVLESFQQNPEELFDDIFVRETFDLIAIADRTGKVIRSNIPLEKVPTDRTFFVVEIQNFPYLAGSISTNAGIAVLGGNMKIRIIPALQDMLKVEEIKITEKPDQNALPVVEGGPFLVFKPLEDEMLGIITDIAQDIQKILFSTIVGFAVIFIAFAFLYIRRPLKELSKASREVEKGNLDVRVTWQTRGDLGHLIRTFNSMITGLRKKDEQIKYRTELLSSLREISYALLNELDREKIFQFCADVISSKTESKCAVLWDGKVKGELEISREHVEKLEDGDMTEIEGNWVVAYSFSVESERGKFKYGKLVCSRSRPFTSVEKEFLSSVSMFVSSACQRIDFIKKLEVLQSIDPATGIFNRRFFVEAIKRELSVFRRFQTPFSIVVLTVTNAETIRERFGYVIFEDIAKAIAGVIRRSVRLYDIPARISFESFAVLLPKTTLENSKVVGERLLEQISTAPEIPYLQDMKIELETKYISTENTQPEKIAEMFS